MLVIGTLYCSKGNFEFGLKLIIKNLYPIEETLGTDTWHYVKRCFLSFIEHLTKKQIKITDPTFFEFILNFLDDVHTQGKNITTVYIFYISTIGFVFEFRRGEGEKYCGI